MVIGRDIIRRLSACYRVERRRISRPGAEKKTHPNEEIPYPKFFFLVLGQPF
jgi:hypothetical protein